MNYKIDFFGKRKIFFFLSLGIMLIGLIFNFIFGTQLDIQFAGGAIVKYSFSGEIDSSVVKSAVEGAAGNSVEVQINSNIVNSSIGENPHNVVLNFSGNQGISLEQQQAITKALQEAFPDNNIQQSDSTSVNPTMGREFFLKCMVAVALASILMVVYVAIRFKKISGWSAGVMALVALLHDVIMIYFTFILFRLPLDDNFIAVVLMILGYSLNDTIVIYDRIRENRKIVGPKADVADLLNLSVNQSFKRTINTSITTVIAIGSVLAVALFFRLDSVVSFALPMAIGVISGCYSTICIAGPLWVMWQKRKLKKEKAGKPE